MYSNANSSASQPRYFIANTDCMAKVLGLGSNSTQVPKGKLEKTKEIQRGTILKEIITDRNDRQASLHRPRQVIATILDGKNSGFCFALELNNMSSVTEEDAELLISVQPPSKRTLLYVNKELMNEAKTIKEGTHVLIDFDDNDRTCMPAVVVRKGRFPKNGDGVLFAVKIMENGKIADSQNFPSSQAELVIPFHKIRIAKDLSTSCSNRNHALHIGSKLQQLTPNVNQSGSVKTQGDTSVKFHLNDRVVWNNNTKPEYGTVVFIGAPEGEKDVCVGVEFDREVVLANGNPNKKALFAVNDKQNGKFLPIGQLMREKDIRSNNSLLNIFRKKNKKPNSKHDIGCSVFYDVGKIQHLPSKTTLTICPPQPQQPKEVDEMEIISVPAFIPEESIVQPSKPVIVNDDTLRRSVNMAVPSPPKTHQKPVPPFQTTPPTQLSQKIPSSPPFSAQVQVKRFPTEQSSTLPVSHHSSRTSLNCIKPMSVENSPPSTSKISSRASPSPTLRKRPSSITESPSSRSARSSRSSERVASSELRTPKDYSDKSVAKHASLLNGKFKDDKKVETWSDKVKYGKAKSSENVNLKMDTSSPSKYDQSNINSYKACLKSPESPDMNDYYHVTQDDCLPNESDCFEPMSDLERYLSLTLESPNNLNGDEFDLKRLPELLSNENDDFVIGSMAEVIIHGEPWYGVIRWLGYVDETKKKVAGIEMEEEHTAFGDGSLNGEQYFLCPRGKGFFIYVKLCRMDGRFLDSLQINAKDGRFPLVKQFGSIDCPAVSGEVPPLSYSAYVLEHLFGKNKGIQGHHNSCYLDATLFSMFTFTSVFDNLLHRPSAPDDIADYNDVQRVLKEEIVNPLRQSMYVRADRVMRLRMLLENLSSVSGLTSEEKDPEEFLNSLLHQILKAEPYLKLSSGQEAYFYQLFVEKNENLKVPTVQQLFDQSFLTSDIKLKEIPSCLIVQMPRHGKQFKMYNRIFPSPQLDITDVLEDSPRQCSVCGDVAEFECRECFYQCPPEFTMKAFCGNCCSTIHNHAKRTNHNLRRIKFPESVYQLKSFPRVQMELFAVVCIETSHYVAFVKCGNESDVPWCFFDSMADRRGEQNGYNIPEIVLCNELSEWLTETGSSLLEKDPDRQLPETTKRLFGDAYLCMYQNSSVMMYH